MTTNSIVDPVNCCVSPNIPNDLVTKSIDCNGGEIGSVVVVNLNTRTENSSTSGDVDSRTTVSPNHVSSCSPSSPQVSSLFPRLSSSNPIDNSCGLCSFKPKSLQFCANEKTFLAIFCLTSVLQGMFYTYFVSVLTTIEKLYQIQSKTTGFIMSATEMGQISGVLFLTYYGGKGNRPKWIGCGMVVFALAALLSASPHYFFDAQARARFSPQPDLPSSLSTSLSPSSSPNDFSQSDVTNIGLLVMRNKLCSKVDIFSNSSSNSGSSESRCASEELTNSSNRLTNSVLAIFFISLLLIGIGSTTTNTLGICYIDDNVAPKESPLYFGITIGVKIFGPVIGFLLGSVCTNIHVDFPFGGSTISNPSDPQWIGAWWLGMIFVFLSLSMASIFMLSFPRALSKPNSLPSSCDIQQKKLSNGLHHEDTNCDEKSSTKKLQITFTNHHNDEPLLKRRDGVEGEHGKEQQSIQCSLSNSGNDVTKASSDSRAKSSDFASTMGRLLKNDILLLRTASSVLHILPIAGIYTFLPKYLESQFQLTASQASAVAGIAGILVMGAGIFSSSFFMRKYKPEPKFVALWIAMVALIYSIGMVILMGLGCQKNNFIGSNINRDPSGNLNTCWKDCSCSGHFAPICTSQKDTYLSPCLAGCTKVDYNSSSYIYSECSCLDLNVTATNGFCPLECANLTWYIVVFAIIVLVHSTGEVGSMLLTLRCVEPQDKAMALGVVSFSIGLFGNVPCPILYGTVVDSACLFWDENCGKLGACRMYDSFKFRTAFHGLTAFIMFIAFIVDFIVWYRASKIKFSDEDEAQNEGDKSKASDLANNKLEKSLNDNQEEDEDDEDDKEVISSTGTRSSELKPLNTVKLNDNAEDMV